MATEKSSSDSAPDQKQAKQSDDYKAAALAENEPTADQNHLKSATNDEVSQRKKFLVKKIPVACETKGRQDRRAKVPRRKSKTPEDSAAERGSSAKSCGTSSAESEQHTGKMHETTDSNATTTDTTSTSVSQAGDSTVANERAMMSLSPPESSAGGGVRFAASEGPHLWNETSKSCDLAAKR